MTFAMHVAFADRQDDMEDANSIIRPDADFVVLLQIDGEFVRMDRATSDEELRQRLHTVADDFADRIEAERRRLAEQESGWGATCSLHR